MQISIPTLLIEAQLKFKLSDFASNARIVKNAIHKEDMSDISASSARPFMSTPHNAIGINLLYFS